MGRPHLGHAQQFLVGQTTGPPKPLPTGAVRRISGPAAGHLPVGPAASRFRPRPQDQMQVVTQYGGEFHVDGEQPGQLLLAVENLVATMREVAARKAFAAAEKGTPHTAGRTVEDAFAPASEQFSTGRGYHNPLLVSCRGAAWSAIPLSCGFLFQPRCDSASLHRAEEDFP